MRRTLPWFLLVAVVLAVGASVTWQLLPSEKDESSAKLLRMEVINACGTPRVGRAVAGALQMRGFDVYTVRADNKHAERTTVVDLRDPDGKNAQSLARALSVQRHWKKLPLGPRYIPDTRVQLDSARYLEVQLVVGDDYRRFFADVVPLY